MQFVLLVFVLEFSHGYVVISNKTSTDCLTFATHLLTLKQMINGEVTIKGPTNFQDH